MTKDQKLIKELFHYYLQKHKPRLLQYIRKRKKELIKLHKDFPEFQSDSYLPEALTIYRKFGRQNLLDQFQKESGLNFSYNIIKDLENILSTFSWEVDDALGDTFYDMPVIEDVKHGEINSEKFYHPGSKIWYCNLNGKLTPVKKEHKKIVKKYNKEI